MRGARDPEPAVLPEDELPHVLLQIPVFNEAEVTEQALRCVAELDWPKDRLHIQLLDNSTDETPQRAEAVAVELRAKGDIHHVRRADRSGFKAGACAEGLKLFDAPFVAMLDADFRPPADWLRRTVPLLVRDDRAGFVQSRCEFSNYRKNWLTRAQGLVQDGHFLVEQRTRAPRRLAVPIQRHRRHLAPPDDRGRRRLVRLLAVPKIWTSPCARRSAAGTALSPSRPFPARCRRGCATIAASSAAGPTASCKWRRRPCCRCGMRPGH